MLRYIAKRILIFIPTLFVISLITFFLSANAPGDPADMILGRGFESASKPVSEQSYTDLRKQLGLDLPLFYFSFSSAAMPDTLYKVANKNQREILARLCEKYGNPQLVTAYFVSVKKLLNELREIQSDSVNAALKQSMIEECELLLVTFDEENINRSLNTITSLPVQFPSLKNQTEVILSDYSSFRKNENQFQKYIPAVHFYGFENRYHHWVSGFLKGDFGISYQDKRPVSDVIGEAMRWTLVLSSLSILLSCLIAVPLGVKSAENKGKKSDNIITTFLFMLHSLPNFWIASLLIIFLCGGDYLNWFPSFGVGNLSPDSSFAERFSDTAYHLILPLFCWTYGSLAYLSRQVRGGMLNTLNLDFIRTARAKGLSEKSVVWKHAFRNSLLPLITILGSLLPLAISGSFVIEFIFSIPGMGKISYDALLARNYPVVYTVVMFAALFTMTGMLIADLLYAMADPRISFSSEKIKND